MTQSILVDVNRCTGCWTCSLACKVAYGLDEDEYRMYVRTIGGGEVDVPGGQWPNLYMKWKPIYKKNCLNCKGCKSTDGMPYCVYNCTNEALTCGDLDDPESPISKEMERLKGMEYRIYQIPGWEDTRDGVYYAERGI